MPRGVDSNSAKDRLRRLLGLFFVALAIPSAVLTWQAYSRLQWESFHQYQLLAEELLSRLDVRMRELIAREEARAITDYRFLVVEGTPMANFLRRSPLSSFPADSEIPGLLGYFQIDADGRFTTPLLPDDPQVSALSYGVSEDELRQRQAVRERVMRELTFVGLADFFRHLPSQLSPGQRQRVALARTLAAESRLCLLDEPFSAQSPQLAEQLRGLLRRRQQQTGFTTLLATADPDLALRTADRIAVLHSGELHQALGWLRVSVTARTSLVSCPWRRDSASGPRPAISPRCPSSATTSASSAAIDSSRGAP